MFTLIITIMIKGWGFNIISIGGFQNEQACKYAGAQQEVVLRNDFQLRMDRQYSFICVPTK